MKRKPPADEEIWQPEPRWHALIAVAAVGGLYSALPKDLIIEPRWLFPAAVFALLVPTVVTHAKKYHRMNRLLGFALNALLTVGMIASVVLLVFTLPDKTETASELLISAGLLWFTNVIVFALWYWRLDAGGPHKREKTVGHANGAFLFPQMTLSPEAKAETAQEEWSPNFVDYLFIAFNTSTAFSPTDVPVLERWAKVLMMLQSVISLTVIALLAARAVNTF
ncbi:MAG: DUF1345 domain-containing protein [Acidobacteria bacterium]|nr:DUF1345 domain-containing protein [Acidobacteriota bacterium]